MKKHYLGLTLLLLCFFGSSIRNNIEAQGCTNATLYPTAVQSILHDGTLKTITTAQYAQEYSADSLIGAITGDQYRFTSSTTTDFLTLRDSAGNYLTSGVTPLLYTIPATIIRKVQLHVNTNASCGTEALSRTITGQLLAPFAYGSSTTVQPSTAVATQGTVNAQVLRLSVVINGSTGTAPNLTNLNVGTGTMTNASLIQTARVYYTGTSTTFATTTQFGSNVSSPGSTFSFTGSQALVTGTNYFFVVYDVACAAAVGDSIDAEVTSLSINSTPYTPTITNPTGNRKISALYAPTRIDGNSTTALAPGTTNSPFVYTAVTGSALCAANVTQVSFTVVGTAPATDITRAKCYYTTSSTFSPSIPFGTAIANPATGSISFNGTQALASGSNYFWLVYDISCTAVATDTLNGNVSSIVIGGTSYTPTGTNPSANAISSAAPVYSTVVDGNWNNPAIWSCGSVPTATTNVLVSNNITVSTGGNVAASVTVASGGTLTMATGGVLTLGTAGGGKQSFTNNGTLTVSGGTLNVNGNVAFNTCTFNMSSGNLNIDPNDGTSAGSVASGTATFAIGSATTDVVTSAVTGGNILINDPPYAGTGYTVVLTSNTSMSWAGSTIKFGGDADTSVTTSTSGFRVDLYLNSGRMAFGNVIVNGRNSNRFVSDVSFGINAANDLTITPGSELRLATSLSSFAGNIINNGTLTTTSTGISLQLITGLTTTAAATPNAQTIGGTGVFRNATTAPTANISSFVINNSSAAGVTLNIPVTISGTLTLTAGKVNTTATNLLTLGVSATAAGTLSNTASAWVNGPFKRWIGASTGNRPFPVGGDSAQLSAINFTTAPTTGGTITARWIAGNAGFPNTTPLMEGSLTVNSISKTGYWQMDAGDGLAGGSYTSLFLPKGYSDVNDYTKLVLVKRPSTGGNWTLDGTHVTTTGSNAAPSLSRTGMSGFSQFAVGGEAVIVLPIKFEYLTGKKVSSTNALNWKVTCTSTSITMVLERSADARTFDRTITTINATQARCGQPFDAVDAVPFNGISYYRLKMIDIDGKVSYSPVAAVMNGKAGAELVGIYPTVVKDQAYLSITSSRNTTMQFSISDMTGKVVATISQAVNSGSSLLPVNTGNLASGVYNITGLLDGTRTQTLRFVKQ